MYRVLVTGSRSARDDAPIARVMEKFLAEWGEQLCVATGGATGVDSLVKAWCLGRGVRFEGFPVDHSLDGPWPGAGPRRNRRMHDAFRPDLVVAFPGGKGTRSMVSIAVAAGTSVKLVEEHMPDEPDTSDIPETPASLFETARLELPRIPLEGGRMTGWRCLQEDPPWLTPYEVVEWLKADDIGEPRVASVEDMAKDKDSHADDVWWRPVM